MNESGFNPTKNDLINIESKILDLKSEKRDLVKSKRNIESSLQIKQLKYEDVQFRSNEFYEIKKERQELKDEATRIEVEIRSVNNNISEMNKLKIEVIDFIRKKDNQDTSDATIKNKLTALKNKYGKFCKDKTRVASMRIMAAEFRDEIEGIIKNMD